MWTRRQVLRLGACSLALASLRCKRPSSPSPSGSPRYIVLVHLDGGLDPIFTTDPKVAAEVEQGLDVIEPHDIASAGGVRLGPHFAPLLPYAQRLAIVNGVHLDTANHYTGWQQLTRLRTNAFSAMPGILDIIGEYGSGQPLACISFGALGPPQYTPGYADGTHVFDLERADKEQLAHARDRLIASATALASQAGDRLARRTAENYRRLGELAERLPQVPPFAPVKWGSQHEEIAKYFQRALWALEHDLTRCAFIKMRPYNGWDSHTNNAIQQANTSRAFTELFARFLRELDTRFNAHGVLAANTMVIAGSEIGRFPRLNGNAGKDHFPECPFVLCGAGIKAGAVYGATDARMAAVPIDLATGHRVTRSGHKLRLDDLGATVLAAAGISPEACGYDGKVLPFLAAA